jgi:hypothetical protein
MTRRPRQSSTTAKPAPTKPMPAQSMLAGDAEASVENIAAGYTEAEGPVAVLLVLLNTTTGEFALSARAELSQLQQMLGAAAKHVRIQELEAELAAIRGV